MKKNKQVKENINQNSLINNLEKQGIELDSIKKYIFTYYEKKKELKNLAK